MSSKQFNGEHTPKYVGNLGHPYNTWSQDLFSSYRQERQHIVHKHNILDVSQLTHMQITPNFSLNIFLLTPCPLVSSVDEIYTPSSFCLFAADRVSGTHTVIAYFCFHQQIMLIGGGNESEQLPTTKQLKEYKEPGEELTVIHNKQAYLCLGLIPCHHSCGFTSNVIFGKKSSCHTHNFCLVPSPFLSGHIYVKD